MGEYKVGDPVAVEVNGIVIEAGNEGDSWLGVQYRCEGDTVETIEVWTEAEGITVARRAPEFPHDSLWRDRGGHLWIAQLDPETQEGVETVRLYSSLGACDIADAIDWYGPFTAMREVNAS